MSTESMEGVPPLDEDVQEMLRCEREHALDPFETGRADHMWRVVAGELAIALGGVDAAVNQPPIASSVIDSASKLSTRPAASTPAPSLLHVGSSQVTSSLWHWAAIFKGYLPWMAISFGLGSGGTLLAEKQLELMHKRAMATHQHAPSPTKTDLPATPVASTVEQPPTAPMVMPVPAAAAMSQLDPSRRKVSGRATRDPGPGSERAVVTRAEAALRRGDWAEALRQTEIYSRQFPRGELGEENLYLAVRASLAGGDPMGATVKMQELHRLYPKSLLVQPSE